MSPAKLVGTLALRRRWGTSLAAAYGVTAIRYPERTAIIDEAGALTFGDVQRRTNALARALRTAGVGERDAVAIMCHNHRGFIEASVACSKLGANLLVLDTALMAPTIADLLTRVDPAAVIYDEEFAALMPRERERRGHFVAWRDTDSRTEAPVLEELIARGDTSELDPPRERRGAAVLAGAETKAGQGIERHVPCSLALPLRPPSTIPLKRGGTTVVAAPMCHPWGFMHLKLGLRLGSTLVLRRRFDSGITLREVGRHEAAALAVLPEMLQRIMGLGRAEVAQSETASLQLIAINSWSLPEELALPAIEIFGPVLYSLQGQTVVQLSGNWTAPHGPSTLASCGGRRRSGLLGARRAQRARRDDGCWLNF